MYVCTVQYLHIHMVQHIQELKSFYLESLGNINKAGHDEYSPRPTIIAEHSLLSRSSNPVSSHSFVSLHRASIPSLPYPGYLM